MTSTSNGDGVNWELSTTDGGLYLYGVRGDWRERKVVIYLHQSPGDKAWSCSVSADVAIGDRSIDEVLSIAENLARSVAEAAASCQPTAADSCGHLTADQGGFCCACRKQTVFAPGFRPEKIQ